jgi:ATP-binding cassette subfamily B protein
MLEFWSWRFPRVKQRDSTDCGAACLSAVAQYYGLRLPVSRIRQLAGTDEKGTSAKGLVEAAKALGFAAKAVRGGPDSLAAIPTPAIAHVVVGGILNHFVVLQRITPSRVVVMDPRDGRTHTISRASFLQEWSGVLLLLVRTSSFSPADRGTPVLLRFWHLLQPHREILSQALVGAAFYTLLGLSSAVFVQKLIDHVLIDGNRNLLNLMGVVMIGLLLIQTFVGATKDTYTLRTGQAIDGALIVGYYRHLIRLPQRFFDTMRVGEIISRVGDAVKIRAFLNDVALELIVNVLVVVFSFGLMLMYSWRLAFVAASIFPLYGFLYWFTNRANRTLRRRMMEHAAELESQLVETLTAAGTVKRFALEELVAERTERRHRPGLSLITYP